MLFGSSYEFGSYKGYSFGVFVDIFVGLFFGVGVSMDEGFGNQVGYFFVVLCIDLLCLFKVFKEEMDLMLWCLCEMLFFGDELVIYVGFKEFCVEQECCCEGILLYLDVFDYLRFFCVCLEVYCEI